MPSPVTPCFPGTSKSPSVCLHTHHLRSHSERRQNHTWLRVESATQQSDLHSFIDILSTSCSLVSIYIFTTVVGGWTTQLIKKHSETGSFPQVEVKISKILKPPPSFYIILRPMKPLFLRHMQWQNVTCFAPRCFSIHALAASTSSTLGPKSPWMAAPSGPPPEIAGVPYDQGLWYNHLFPLNKAGD